MKFKFAHLNFNVMNLKESLCFYDEALSLKETRRLEAEDNSYIIVYLSDEKSPFELELTWLKNHQGAYDLGEAEFHLALEVENFAEAFKKHQNMGVVCLVNEEMGIYFINDPDGYWIEIVPTK